MNNSTASGFGMADLETLLWNSKPNVQTSIAYHPENAELLLKFLRMKFPGAVHLLNDVELLKYVTRRSGIAFTEHVLLPRWTKVWEFPKTPFVEYEEKDEVWAIPLKFGRWVDSEIPAFYKIDLSPAWSPFKPLPIPGGWRMENRPSNRWR